MKSKVLISVIVPLYNKEQWIMRCILSIMNQSYQNIEILIINDGSTDNSLKVVTTFDDSRIKIFNKPNGGLSSARNYGIEKAKGEYIALIDADDEWETKHIELLLEGFKKSDNVILVCSDLMETTDGKKKNALKRTLPFHSLYDNNTVHYYLIEDYIQTLKDGYFLLSGSSVLIKSKIIKNHSLIFFSEAEPAEDINYWLRLNKLGDFVFCDYVGLYYHRVDDNSIMNKKTNQAKLTPPFFYGINMKNYSKDDNDNINKFLSREYYKKAYQNRGLPLTQEELSTQVGGGVQIGRWNILTYLAIRYCPQFIFTLYKKIRTSSDINA